MKGAVKLHDRPPSDVSFIKFGGQTAFKKDYMAIKSDIHTLSAKGVG